MVRLPLARAILVLLVLAFAGAAATTRKRGAEPTAPGYATRPETGRFADELAAATGLDRGWVLAQLAKARQIDAVRQLIMPPAAGTAKNWAAYRAIFVEPRRVETGAAFWRNHRLALQRAHQRWGVPPEIVVGIIGVETFFGTHMGGYRVLDALATLAFDFPAGRRDRTPFFRAELGEFLQWAKREKVDPAAPRGSYAGAIGWPQFMPSSINRYAVDFDGDGRIELQRNPVDAIGSVAHYLAAFGWQEGLPTHFAVKAPVDTADRAALLAPDIVPSFSPAQFGERGAVLEDGASGHGGLLALVELQNGELAPSYVAGTSNFYVITRYNWSSYYAMAVIELGAAIKAAMRP